MRRAGLSYRGKLRLSTTSQSASQTAPLVGEPLAKPFTLRGLPRPLLLGAVGAAASRMRAAAKQTLGAATRAPFSYAVLFHALPV